MWTREEQRMNETIFENLPRKMNLISDLFSRVVFRDKEACQDLVRIILGEGYEVTEVTSQYGQSKQSCMVRLLGCFRYYHT